MDEENKDLNVDETNVNEVKPEITKNYTEEEHKAQLQSETDKRVSQALQTAKDKWESEFKDKLAVEKTEAEKLATMTAEERTNAELDKQKLAFEEEKKSFLKQKLELETIKELSAEGLPTEFTSYVMADTAEEISKKIKAFKSEFQRAIEVAVDEKLKGRTPKASNVSGSSITKEEFKAMGYKDRAKLIEENPELYEELKG